MLWLPAIVMGLNLVYMNVVPAEADVGLVRYGEQPDVLFDQPLLKRTLRYLADVIDNPLDVALCPSLKWGCRYLRVDHRTLVEHVWDEKAMADLRGGSADQAKLAAIEGLVLRDRSLRFAVLDESESSLFAADLIDADLRQASLRNARLRGAKLRRTQLQGAHLYAAGLQGADLFEAGLAGAGLWRAQLQGANLSGSRSFVQPQRVFLDRAQLQGADLNGAQLQGADLNGARLWRASFDNQTDLGLSDLQGADFNTTTRERFSAPRSMRSPTQKRRQLPRSGSAGWSRPVSRWISFG